MVLRAEQVALSDDPALLVTTVDSLHRSVCDLLQSVIKRNFEILFVTELNLLAHLLQLRHFLAVDQLIILFNAATSVGTVVCRVEVILMTSTTDGEPTRKPRQRFTG